MTTSNTAGLTPAGPQIWPTLRCRDLRTLIGFYEAAFGFRAGVAYPDHTGQLVHAELAGPRGGGIMLGLDGNDYVDPRQRMPVAPIRCYVVEPDPDALFFRAIAAGADVVREPYDTPHGTRDCELQDPEGNRWLFGTSPGELPAP
ncbi:MULTISPECIES: VOC family protein [Amycolatopsis]|uniref:VOC family protein n=1 Tax=Amycolatopsis TaxID=1813 RepID=UPI001C588649|nr:VOC family protein [Amycolatopsis sp. TNS106]QXV61122.1 glyoxalase [Amycolatopsis sp. TNS106]